MASNSTPTADPNHSTDSAPETPGLHAAQTSRRLLPFWLLAGLFLGSNLGAAVDLAREASIDPLALAAWRDCGWCISKGGPALLQLAGANQVAAEGAALGMVTGAIAWRLISFVAPPASVARRMEEERQALAAARRDASEERRLAAEERAKATGEKRKAEIERQKVGLERQKVEGEKQQATLGRQRVEEEEQAVTLERQRVEEAKRESELERQEVEEEARQAMLEQQRMEEEKQRTRGETRKAEEENQQAVRVEEERQRAALALRPSEREVPAAATLAQVQTDLTAPHPTPVWFKPRHPFSLWLWPPPENGHCPHCYHKKYRRIHRTSLDHLRYLKPVRRFRCENCRREFVVRSLQGRGL